MGNLGAPPPAIYIPKPAVPAGEKGYKRLKKANTSEEAPKVPDVNQLGEALFGNDGAEDGKQNGPSQKASS